MYHRKKPNQIFFKHWFFWSIRIQNQIKFLHKYDLNAIFISIFSNQGTSTPARQCACYCWSEGSPHSHRRRRPGAGEWPVRRRTLYGATHVTTMSLMWVSSLQYQNMYRCTTYLWKIFQNVFGNLNITFI